MCLDKQRHNHITPGNNLIPISIPFMDYSDHSCLDSLSLADCYIACGEGEYTRMDIRIKLLPGDVGVYLLAKTYPLLAQLWLCYTYPISKLVSCTCSAIPICPFLFQYNIIGLYSHVSTPNTEVHHVHNQIQLLLIPS